LIIPEKVPKTKQIFSGRKSKNGIQKGIALCTDRTNIASFCAKGEKALMMTSGFAILSPKVSSPSLHSPKPDSKKSCERLKRYSQFRLSLKVDKAINRASLEELQYTAKTMK
jgi:hypothetical protein